MSTRSQQRISLQLIIGLGFVLMLSLVFWAYNLGKGRGAVEHRPLQRRAEHVEREGVEEQVHEVAVQEAVADHLPGQEADAEQVAFGRDADRMVAQRPEREVLHDRIAREHLQQEADAQGPEQADGGRGKSHAEGSRR